MEPRKGKVGMQKDRRTSREQDGEVNHEIHKIHEKTKNTGGGEKGARVICTADESYRIMGACFEVYKIKGCGFLEPVYQECLEIELEPVRDSVYSESSTCIDL